MTENDVKIEWKTPDDGATNAPGIRCMSLLAPTIQINQRCE
jgi:hypothetical protein